MKANKFRSLLDGDGDNPEGHSTSSVEHRRIFNTLNTTRDSSPSTIARPQMPSLNRNPSIVHAERRNYMKRHASHSRIEKQTVKEVIAYCIQKWHKLVHSNNDEHVVTAQVCDLIMTYASCTGTHSHVLQPLVQVLMHSIYKDLSDYKPGRLGEQNVRDLGRRDTYVGGSRALEQEIEDTEGKVKTLKAMTKKIGTARVIRQKVFQNAIHEWRKNLMWTAMNTWRKNVSNIRRQRILLTTSMNQWNHRFSDPSFTKKVWVLDWFRYCVRKRKLAEAKKRLNFRNSFNDTQKKDLENFLKKLNDLKLALKEMEKNYESIKTDHYRLDNKFATLETERLSLLGKRNEYAIQAYVEMAEITLRHLQQDLKDVQASSTPDLRRMWYDDPSKVFSFSKKEALQELMNCSEQDLILIWLNFQYRSLRDDSGKLKSKNVSTICNFTDDLRGGIKILEILVNVLPETVSSKLKDVLDIHEPNDRVKQMLNCLKNWKPGFEKLVSADHLLYGEHPDRIATFLARVFCMHPNIPIPNNWNSHLEEIEEMLEDLDCVSDMVKRKSSKSPFFKKEFYTEDVKDRNKKDELSVSPSCRPPKFQLMPKSSSSQSPEINSNIFRHDEEFTKILRRFEELLGSENEILDQEIKHIEKIWKNNAKNQYSRSFKDHVDNVNDVELKNCNTYMKDLLSMPAKVRSSPRLKQNMKKKRRFVLSGLIHALGSSELGDEVKQDKITRPSRAAILPGSSSYDYSKWLSKELPRKLEELWTHTQTILEDFHLVSRTWRCISARMECYIIRSLTNSLRGCPEPCVDHHIMKETQLLSLNNLDFQDIFALETGWDAKEQIKGVETVLAKEQLHIKQIYQNYAQDDEQDTYQTMMNELEYSSFLKDSKVTGKLINPKLSMQLFRRVCDRRVAAIKIQRWFRFNIISLVEVCVTSSIPLRNGKPVLKTERMLSRQDFIIILIKIAYYRQKSATLAERLKELIEILKRNTRQLHASGFRKQVRSANFYVVFEKYRWHLRHIFIYFAAQIANPKNYDSLDETMNKTEWSDMLRCVRLLEPDGPITIQNMDKIFSNSRTEEYDASSQVVEESEPLLTYPDFLEALVILACFRHSDPYEPLKLRFERFLKEDFLPSCLRWMNSPAGKQMAKKAESKSREKEILQLNKRLSTMKIDGSVKRKGKGGKGSRKSKQKK
mmetsp:Transcript_5578/g.8800  ORF Transcript_5578/g.8800 Transcript_5578/m.8800 type:complete len:1183 (+) Transcript_5578:82-3630(+)